MTLAKRAEEAGLNASAPPQQGLIEGWLLRLSPGKAKRSRCVNALAQGSTLSFDDLLARCRQAFDAVGLPLIVRVTPFSQPADLDARLAAKGWFEFDTTDVMVRADLADLAAQDVLEAVAAPHYAQLVGTLRGSNATEIAAHAERMLAAPVPYQAYLLRDSAQQLLACGQFVREGDIVGLYDIFTPPEQRGRGHARRLCLALLGLAREQGAQQAYLQVSGDNEAAQRLYTGLGFALAYRYHYRSDDPAAR